jgi:cell division protein FtsQ
MPILAYAPKAAQERLAENPWIKSANVERRLPDTIFIRINERKPAARWQLDGKLALVDSEGVALTTENLDQCQSLPIIIGQNARHKVVDLFMLLQAEPAIGKQVAAATWIGDRRWDLKLKNDMVIRLPAAQPELALSQLARLDEKQQVLARDLTAIDLRLPHKAILQPTPRANALIERPNFSDKVDNSKKNI